MLLNHYLLLYLFMLPSESMSRTSSHPLPIAGRWETGQKEAAYIRYTLICCVDMIRDKEGLKAQKLNAQELCFFRAWLCKSKSWKIVVQLCVLLRLKLCPAAKSHPCTWECSLSKNVPQLQRSNEGLQSSGTTNLLDIVWSACLLIPNKNWTINFMLSIWLEFSDQYLHLI